MIGFILGTSEGRKILSLINKYTNNIAVSTATAYGGELLKEFNIKSLNIKPLNKEEMIDWIKLNKIDVLVDASHPYAEEVTKNSLECAKALGIPFVRYERLGVLDNIISDNIIRIKNYDEAIEVIKNIKGNILNTTGGNNVTKFINLDFDYRIIHRVLPSPNVVYKIVDAGISLKNIIAMQGPISYDLEKAFIKQYDIKGILTKDSGIEGGVLEKYNAVKDADIKLIVIERPKSTCDNTFINLDELVEYLVKKYNLKQSN